MEFLTDEERETVARLRALNLPGAASRVIQIASERARLRRQLEDAETEREAVRLEWNGAVIIFHKKQMRDAVVDYLDMITRGVMPISVPKVAAKHGVTSYGLHAAISRLNAPLPAEVGAKTTTGRRSPYENSRTKHAIDLMKEQGMSVAEAARAVGLKGAASLYSALQRYGIEYEKNPNYGRWDDETAKKMESAVEWVVEAGFTVAEAAEREGVEPEQLRYALKKRRASGADLGLYEEAKGRARSSGAQKRRKEG